VRGSFTGHYERFISSRAWRVTYPKFTMEEPALVTTMTGAHDSMDRLIGKPIPYASQGRFPESIGARRQARQVSRESGSLRIHGWSAGRRADLALFTGRTRHECAHARTQPREPGLFRPPSLWTM